MFASDHDIDQEYLRGTSIAQSSDHVDEVVKDIDISPLLCLPQKILNCCNTSSSAVDDGRSSVGSTGTSFSELTQRLLITSHTATTTPSTTLNDGDAQQGNDRNQPILINKNIFNHYLLLFLQNTAESLWRGTVLSIFIVQLTFDTKTGTSEYFRTVGYLEGMYGLGRIIAKLFYPDELSANKVKNNVRRVSKVHRQQVRDSATHTPSSIRQHSFTLKVAGLILALTSTSNIIMLATLPNYTSDIKLFYQLLMPLLLFYGYSTWVLLRSSASNALFHQSLSVSSSQCIKREQIERPIILVANIFGTLLSIIIFGILGNSFSIRNLRIVWFVGSGLQLIVGLLSLRFSERYHVDIQENEEVDDNDDLEGPLPVEDVRDEIVDYEDEIGIDDSDRDLQETIDRVLSDDPNYHGEDEIAVVADYQAQQQIEGGSSLEEPLLPASQASVTFEGRTSVDINGVDENKSSRVLALLPPILCVTFVLLFVAGGALFYPYWPVFIKDVASLPPIQLQTLYIFIPLGALLCDTAFQKSIGLQNIRIGITMTYRLLGATFVMIIGTDGYSNWNYGSGVALSVLFVLRMACVTSASKIETGLFMKYIASIIDNTIIWKQGVEMATLVLWSIFASVGGVLVEAKSLPDSGYGKGYGGGGYGYVLRLTGALLEFSGVLIMAAVILCRYYNIGVKDKGS